MTKLTIRLTFDGPVNVGSGALGGAMADKPLTRDARGLPMIPASTFKGKLRHEVERLTPMLYPGARQPCAAPIAETMCQGDAEPCLVCQLFGSPWVAGKLTFGDFRLVEPEFLTRDEPPIGEQRYGVGLSRYRKVAEDQLLYTTEVFLPGAPLTFEGYIAGDLLPDELDLLQAGLTQLLTVGGGKTQGLGWVDTAVEIDVAQPPSEGIQDVLENIGDTLDIVVRLQSPLLLGNESNEANYKTTRAYIPGSALRGAAAQQVLRSESIDEQPQHNDLEKLFNAETLLVVENLYPTTARGREWSFPAPHTARSCKYHRGFKKAEDKAEQGHGVGDILIRQTVFEHMLTAQQVRLPALYKPHCPECGADVDAFEDFIVMIASGRFDAIRVPVRRASRTAINRQRGVAEDGQLYTLEFIEPVDSRGRPTAFRGRLWADREQRVALIEGLSRVTALGGSKTRGLGQVTVEILSPEDKRRTSLPKIEERLATFNAAVREEWGFYERVADAPPLPEDVYFFSVDLLSAAILTWHSIPVNTPLPLMLGLDERVSLVRAFADYSIAGGWHMGANLPRRKQPTVEMGSVFMYRSQGYTLAELAERLAHVEKQGIGRERARGFGRVTICLPFHYQPEVDL
ncbi:MAG: CRISPR-associated RAMP protein Csx10 [Anaerolineae bacterium]|nr:CRISPR-associated RAMP protein Csx10 [Anaerolineae bacterium]